MISFRQIPPHRGEPYPPTTSARDAFNLQSTTTLEISTPLRWTGGERGNFQLVLHALSLSVRSAPQRLQSHELKCNRHHLPLLQPSKKLCQRALQMASLCPPLANVSQTICLQKNSRAFPRGEFQHSYPLWSLSFQ